MLAVGGDSPWQTVSDLPPAHQQVLQETGADPAVVNRLLHDPTVRMKELRDDRVVYVATYLWPGVYSASYIARATTPGKFATFYALVALFVLAVLFAFTVGTLPATSPRLLIPCAMVSGLGRRVTMSPSHLLHALATASCSLLSSPVSRLR